MSPRTTTSGRRRARVRRRPPVPVRRPALYLGVAAAGALMGNVVLGAGPAAQGADAPEPARVAHELGLTARTGPATPTPDLDRLHDLTASRSTREAQQTAAQQQQQAADQAELDRQKAEADAPAAAAAAAAAAASSATAASSAAAEQQTAGTAVTETAHITDS